VVKGKASRGLRIVKLLGRVRSLPPIQPRTFNRGFALSCTESTKPDALLRVRAQWTEYRKDRSPLAWHADAPASVHADVSPGGFESDDGNLRITECGRGLG
jgi:hypothetical protein